MNAKTRRHKQSRPTQLGRRIPQKNEPHVVSWTTKRGLKSEAIEHGKKNAEEWAALLVRHGSTNVRIDGKLVERQERTGYPVETAEALHAAGVALENPTYVRVEVPAPSVLNEQFAIVDAEPNAVRDETAAPVTYDDNDPTIWRQADLDAIKKVEVLRGIASRAGLEGAWKGPNSKRPILEAYLLGKPKE